MKIVMMMKYIHLVRSVRGHQRLNPLRVTFRELSYLSDRSHMKNEYDAVIVGAGKMVLQYFAYQIYFNYL